MPELPDVQIFKEYLDATALHQRISEVSLHEPDLLKGVSKRRLISNLRDSAFKRTHRHGKHMFIEVSGGEFLRLHFGMTGFLRYWRRNGREPDHVGVEFDFSSGFSLGYVTQRKLGEVGWTRDIEAFLKRNHIGPDALDPDFDAGRWREALEGRRGSIKGALMNQEILAGIGNVYADEILLRAGIHPKASVERLGERSLDSIHRAMRTVLKAAIEARVREDSFPSYFILPHREEGAECPRCGRRLKTIKVSGRTTYYCPDDQRRKT